MVNIKGIEYSGQVTEGDDEISVILCSTDMLSDIVEFMADVKEVTYTPVSGIKKVYPVTCPISASFASKNVYVIRFSTKPTETQRLEAKNQELSDAIDDILVMMLEE